jgi:hypothetical protein
LLKLSRFARRAPAIPHPSPSRPPPQRIEHAGALAAGQQLGRVGGIGIDEHDMASVYEAHDDELNVSVAPKVIKSDAAVTCDA